MKPVCISILGVRCGLGRRQKWAQNCLDLPWRTVARTLAGASSTSCGRLWRAVSCGWRVGLFGHLSAIDLIVHMALWYADASRLCPLLRG